MKLQGVIKDGKQIDSKRENWDQFGFNVFKGTLNVGLNKLVNIEELDYDFTVWDKFRVKKGKLQVNRVLIDVFVGYKYSTPQTSLFFIFAKDKLRDKYKLENGFTVEVML